MDIVTGLGVDAVNERTLVNDAKLSSYIWCMHRWLWIECRVRAES